MNILLTLLIVYCHHITVIDIIGLRLIYFQRGIMWIIFFSCFYAKTLKLVEISVEKRAKRRAEAQQTQKAKTTDWSTARGAKTVALDENTFTASTVTNGSTNVIAGSSSVLSSPSPSPLRAVSERSERGSSRTFSALTNEFIPSTVATVSQRVETEWLNDVHKTLYCCTFNAQSIVNKVSELRHLLYGGTFDLLLITETWLHDGISTGLLDPAWRQVLCAAKRPHTLSWWRCLCVC